MLNFGEELGGKDVDFLVGAVQQAECSDLVGGGRVVSGCLGFLAAVCGLESCDFGSLFAGKCESSVLFCAFVRVSVGHVRTSFLWCRHS